MEILVLRQRSDGGRTHGDLYLDGQWTCYTLEDQVRPNDKKVSGETAIPEGKYQVIVNHSPRFGKQLPLLLKVPHFSGVRIHAGNTEEDTEGCLLVGQGREETRITDSREALEDLMCEIEGAIQGGGKVWITIENAKENIR